MPGGGRIILQIVHRDDAAADRFSASLVDALSLLDLPAP
jgi:hypothetical protein